MSQMSEQTLVKSLRIPFVSILQVVLGSLFLAASAQVSIPLPFTPVPISLQSLAVVLLAISLGPRKATYAIVAICVKRQWDFLY